MTDQSSVYTVMQRRVTGAKRLNDHTYAAFALIAATIAALVWANVGTSYEAFWSTTAGFRFAGTDFVLPLSDWVDEGLMALFFFMVGLDVRRELTLGELRQKERAILPVAAACGGLAVPALLFLAVSGGQDFASAWGSVISTDTAFALGMLALVGPRNAPRLRVFLLALAVIDDIGALSAIAVFYTEDLNLLGLGLAGLGLLAVWLLARRGVWRVTPYAVLGVFTWGAMFASGVHATLAGVLLALLMPVYAQRRRDVEFAALVFRLFRQAPGAHTARGVRSAVAHSVPLNQSLSSVLPPYVNYGIVPLFALGNAGVPFSSGALADTFTSQLTWAVIVGLVLGKFLGITLAAAVVMKLVPSARLPGLDLPRVAGAGALSGMGFTISLLVVGLALEDPDRVDQARIGVLAASVLALMLAWTVFRIGDRLRPMPEEPGAVLQREVDPHRDHIRGAGGSDVVVYAAINYEYRHGAFSALSDVQRRLGDGPDGVRVVFRHNVRTEAELTAALALEAAAVQGRFWEMHDVLASSRMEIDADSVAQAAATVGLDADALRDRVLHGQDTSRVEDDALDLAGMELDENPIRYVDGRLSSRPANTFTVFEELREARQRQS